MEQQENVLDPRAAGAKRLKGRIAIAIVNVGSNSPRGTMRLPYAASKGGVFAITTSLAVETATMGIRINCVARTSAPSRRATRSLVASPTSGRT